MPRHREASNTASLESSRPSPERGWPHGSTTQSVLPDPAEHSQINLYFALQLEQTGFVWLKARGTSMLPWAIPGCELKIEPVGPELESGLIVVFRQGHKLYFHRVIERINSQHWLTKGDALVYPDLPVSNPDILGYITAVRRGNRIRSIRPDRDAACLSLRLGHWFGRPDGQPVGRFKRRTLRLVYLLALFGAWPFRRYLTRADLNLCQRSTRPKADKD